MNKNTEFKNIVPVVFKSVALAMAVAVVVLHILKAAPLETQVLLLGLGFFCQALVVLGKEDRDE